MARAFQEMLSGRPGPVALEMPWDQFPARRPTSRRRSRCRSAPTPVPDPDKIAALAKLVDAAKAPMIVGRRRRTACRPPRSARWRRSIGAPVVSFRSRQAASSTDRHPLGLTIASPAIRLWDRPIC